MRKRALFFGPLKKRQKICVFIVLPILQTIYKAWRAVLPIVHPIFEASFLKKHWNYHIIHQFHFEKSIVDFLFSHFFNHVLCCFKVKHPIHDRHYFSNIIDILGAKNDVFENKLYIFFIVSFFLKLKHQSILKSNVSYAWKFQETKIEIPSNMLQISMYRRYYFSKLIDVLASKRS